MTIPSSVRKDLFVEIDTNRERQIAVDELPNPMTKEMRMKDRSQKLIVMSALLVAILFLAVSPLFSGGARETDVTTMTVGVAALPSSMDLEMPSAPGCQMVTPNRQLALKWGNEPYPFDPELAAQGVRYPVFDPADIRHTMFESYELSSDGRSATFRIKPGLMSIHGNEFTADDVKFTFERAWGVDGFRKWLLGQSGVTSPDDITVVDKYTVQFDIQEPNPLIAMFHGNTWSAYLDSTEVKKHMTSSDPWARRWMDRNDQGWGPYKMVDWEAGDYIVYEAREEFGEPDGPHIDRIVFREIPESSNRVALLEQGSIDMALALQPEEFVYLQGRPGVKTYNIRSANYTYIIMNVNFEPFSDKRVRQAINYAAPREDIAHDIFRGLAEPMESMVSTVLPGISSDDWIYSYDLAKAKQLLSEAGYPDGFAVELSYDNAQPWQEAIAVAMRSSLEQIGIRVNLRAMTVSALVEAKARKELDFTIETGLPVQPDVNYALTIFYKPGTPLNFGNYENDEVLDLMIRGASIVDNDERNAFHQSVHKMLIEDPPVVPVVATNFQVAMRENIGGDLVFETCQNFYWHHLRKE